MCHSEPLKAAKSLEVVTKETLHFVQGDITLDSSIIDEKSFPMARKLFKQFAFLESISQRNSGITQFIFMRMIEISAAFNSPHPFVE